MPNPRPRPVFLNPLRIQMPAMALLSIAHRVAGLAMALLIPALLYLLDLSLRGPDDFVRAVEYLRLPAVRILLALTTWALLHHLLAGVRYLLIDMGWGSELGAARVSAWVVNLGAPALALIYFGVVM